MAITVLKVFYKKQKSKIISSRSYKNLRNQLFQRKINREVMEIEMTNADFSEFTEIVVSVHNKHAPKKQKFIRANKSNFITKNLSKAHVTIKPLK